MVMGYLDATVSPIPAVLSPNIIVFPRGSGYLEAPDGTITALPRACLKGPCLEPRKVHCSPNSVFISILFRAGFMAEALGPAVGEFRDLVTPLDTLFPRHKLALLLERMDEDTRPVTWAELVQDFLLDCLRTVQHPRPSIPLDAVFRPVRAIAADLGVSVRQVERRMDWAYGANLRDVRRMVRFGYCFAKLTTTPLQRGGLIRIAQDFGYFDHSHMDRDFRALAGNPPGAIVDAAADGGPGQWLYRLGKQDFRNLFLLDDVDSVQGSIFGMD